MFNYTITKYKTFCISNYSDEWGAISDIGKEYHGKVLTLEEYKETEDAYIKALLMILEYMGIKELYLNMTLPNGKEARYEHKFFDGTESLYGKDILDTYENIKSGIITIEQFEHMARLQLREDIGGSIYVPYRFKLFIGYDYMMSVRTSRDISCLIEDIEKLGLYVAV